MLFQQQHIIQFAAIYFIRSLHFILIKIRNKIWRCG